MQEELIQFKCNDVKDLVPRSVDKSVIKWIFRNKMDEKSVITINKERLVAK